MKAERQQNAYKRATGPKTGVVSVRLEPHIKVALQMAAERELRSVANMVEVMVVAYCRANEVPLDGVREDALPAAKPPAGPGGRKKP